MDGAKMASMDGGNAGARRGCIFCKSGKEQDVVRRFGISFPGSRAIVPTRTRYRRTREGVFEEQVTLLPGYVFFEMEPPLAGEPADGVEPALRAFCRTDSVLKLLRYSDGNWQLHGADDRFAQMLFKAGGNIGISRAYFDEGRRIRILEGFLKDYEGSVVRVNKKNKMVEVSVDFQEKRVSMWLGYELVAENEPQG